MAEVYLEAEADLKASIAVEMIFYVFRYCFGGPENAIMPLAEDIRFETEQKLHGFAPGVYIGFEGGQEGSVNVLSEEDLFAVPFQQD